MKVFAIGDMHLEGGTGKTMDRFGDHWRDHSQRIFAAWERTIGEGDLVLICGDTTWAMRLAEAAPDLNRIGQMSGRKILLKGNHDYWWETASKLRKTLHASITPLNGSSIIVERIAIAATRGWNCPGHPEFTDHDLKIYNREVGRLASALSGLEPRRREFDKLIVALHYPPTGANHAETGFLELIDKHRADICVYGHLHGEDIKTALTGRRNATTFYLVSADAVNFAPLKLRLNET